MTPKKQKSKVQFREGPDSNQGDEELDKGVAEMENAKASSEPQPEMSEQTAATVTSTESAKKRYGSARGVSAMYKVVVKKAQGKKTKVTCNSLGVPIGENRHVLQSYTGMLARTMIPINHPNWPSVDAELKDKLWLDIQDTFKIPKELKNAVLKSASAKWRQFKANLTKDYVKPNVGNKKKLRKPPKQYAFIGKEAWKKFVAERTTRDWQALSAKQSLRVQNRKYHHRTSRKGYIGLIEEEQKNGNLEPGEIPDRAVLWKKARKLKPEEEVDSDLEDICKTIDTLLEKQSKGEFNPCGSDDVLTTALETPEHSGRVRGVGSFVSPSVFFNIPNGKRCRITKAELLARDRERDEELKKAKQDMAEEIEKTRKEMAELRTILKSNVSSPMLSDKASCDSKAEDAQKAKPEKTKPAIAKNLLDDDVAIIEYAAVPPENKGPKKCELAVETIENKVAFGLLFDDEDMNKSIHGVALQPGCARVSVDGAIQRDALIPIPIKGEIETVDQAVGTYVSWPRDLIILPNGPVVEKKKRKEKEPKTELEKVQRLFKSVEINKKVPQRFRLLYKHATTFMKSSGGSIQMPCDAEVFGAEKTIFILAENIIALLEFQMIGQGAISAYMAYLHTVVRDNDELEMYAFCDPATIFTNSTDIERNLVNRLKEGNPDRLFLLPYNTNCHWILVILWAGEIFVLNPLPRGTNFPELEKALTRAMITFNVQAGRGNKAPSIKYMPGCPKQPGGIECGYVVMRYMREIIMDHELSFLKKWALKTRKLICSEAELDEVRFEALSHIESFM